MRRGQVERTRGEVWLARGGQMMFFSQATAGQV